MGVNYGVSDEIGMITYGDDESAGLICHVYYGTDHDPIFSFHEGSVPVISHYGASDGGGAGNQNILTIDRSDLPISPTVSGDFTNATGYDLRRIVPGSDPAVVASSPSAATSMHYVENLTSTFRPDSNGWVYNLAVHNSALMSCGTVHATCKIRTIELPTITSLTAEPAAGSDGIGGFIQCISVNWAATSGDPPATWSFSQTGHHIAHLPSARNSAPGRGPQRVCIPVRTSETTTLTLTGTNESGSVHRSVTLHWMQ